MTGPAYRRIPLARPCPDILAVGAYLNNTLCAIKGAEAFVGPTIGDLETAEAIQRFEAEAEAMIRTLDLAPVLLAHDLHPDFYSTRWAKGRGYPCLPVQHHHAHIASVMAEHRLEGPVLGLALDGFGLGPSNQSWGGELLRVDGTDFTRIGHLAPMAQPGGDIAARETWRMAASALHRMGRGGEIASRFPDYPAAQKLSMVLDRKLNSPLTSSAGRLFDAACGLLGVYPVAEFEGQAPMALEAMVRIPMILPSGWVIADDVLDLLPLLEALLGRPAAEGAELFHGTLIAALTDWVEQAADRTGLRRVAMAGGCFFNKVLRKGLSDALKAQGLAPLFPEALVPGDAGLALGQAWIAAQTATRS